MSRSRKADGREAAAVAREPVTPAGAGVAPTQPLRAIPRRIRLLRLAVAAFVGWVIALAAMAILTANPVVVSGEQIARSDAVVVARPIAGKPQVRIERVLSGNLSPEDVVTVLNLLEVPTASEEKSYVVPLTRFRQDYVITMLKSQRPPPLIYPSTPETIGKARDLLREAGH